MNKYPLIRRIYLYLFAFIGLVLITIGCVRLVGLGLKTYIFKEADIYYNYPMAKPAPIPADSTGSLQEAGTTTAREPSEKEVKAFEEKQRRSNRQREAAESIAMIIVGLPLYFYHWRVIRRDKEQEVNEKA